jgi:NADPH-dependent 2,4-dienoyl-CoA reductase/sulfur reductase-like enzyme
MRLVAVGGSDVGISAALRARELDPNTDVSVVLADAYPNFSICGIPYYVSGEVTHWRNLAHRTRADLEATGMTVRLDTTVTRIDVAAHRVLTTGPQDATGALDYDALVVGTGALPVRPPIAGLDALGPGDGVHLLHSMGDTFALMQTLERDDVHQAVIVGAGYIGLEMAEALTARGLHVTQVEQLHEVLPTVDPELGARVRHELERHGVTVLCRTRVDAISRAPAEASARLQVTATGPDDQPLSYTADVVLVVVGVRPDSDLAAAAGAELGARHAVAVDRQMRTNLPDVFAAGDCAITYHRLLGDTYLPLGTTAHKQGRVAAENALGGSREFAGSLGTQVVKVFDLVAARTGLRDHEATAAGFEPLTVPSEADDHKRYYFGSHPRRSPTSTSPTPHRWAPRGTRFRPAPRPGCERRPTRRG